MRLSLCKRLRLIRLRHDEKKLKKAAEPSVNPYQHYCQPVETVFCPAQMDAGTGQLPGQWMPSGYSLSWGDEAKRNPILLLRLSGVLLLRFDTRQFCGVLFQEPPRFTRLEPLWCLPLYRLHNQHLTNVCFF